MAKLGIKILDDRIRMPRYAHLGDSGFDVFPLEESELAPGEVKLVRLGFALDIPWGYEIQIRSRSGLSLKKQVVVLNSPATIDWCYTGEIGVILKNQGNLPYKITVEQAIAQMVLAPVVKAELVQVQSIEKNSDRSTRGYGSSDAKSEEKDSESNSLGKVDQSIFPKLVFFTGYSGSGKTTHCIPVLKELGYEVLSSSVLLHEFCDRLAKNVFGLKVFDSYDREDYFQGDLKCKFGPFNYSFFASSRIFLIDLAEKALVPVFTRAVFTHAIADRIITSPDKKFAINVFNDEEFSLLMKRLRENSRLGSVTCFNLRRDSEDSKVDKRSLLPFAMTINNNSTYEDLKASILRFLSC